MEPTNSPALDWMASFYATDDDFIDIDYSRYPGLGTLYPYLFFLESGPDGKVHLKPDQARLYLVFAAFTLLAFPEMVAWDITERGMRLRSIPESISLARHGTNEKVTFHWNDFAEKPRAYDAHYPSRLDELSQIFLTLQHITWSLLNPTE